MQLPRVDMIIFDRISRLQDARRFKARNGFKELLLNLFGQGCRNAVRIDRGIVEPLRLQKDLMLVPVRKSNDLVLDRRAVAWSCSFEIWPEYIAD